jgi:DNA-binding CsgD family transcriptional regulator
VIDLVAVQAQAVSGGAVALRPARARVLLPGEGWLHIRADVLGSATGERARIAVTLEPASRTELTPLLLALYGLTPRERAVTELLVARYTTEAIAQQLALSRHTVRDYTKSVFAKTGVSSRPALTAAFGPDRRAA